MLFDSSLELLDPGVTQHPLTQEMDAWHVREYLGLMDAVVRPGGIVFNSNSHAHHYRGAWPWPARWRVEFRRTLPGVAWTPNHFTYVFRIDQSRGEEDASTSGLSREGDAETLRLERALEVCSQRLEKSIIIWLINIISLTLFPLPRWQWATAC